MGEGTTGIGALELGVYFTGIEIDKERCDKAYSKLLEICEYCGQEFESDDLHYVRLPYHADLAGKGQGYLSLSGLPSGHEAVCCE